MEAKGLSWWDVLQKPLVSKTAQLNLFYFVFSFLRTSLYSALRSAQLRSRSSCCTNSRVNQDAQSPSMDIPIAQADGCTCANNTSLALAGKWPCPAAWILLDPWAHPTPWALFSHPSPHIWAHTMAAWARSSQVSPLPGPAFPVPPNKAYIIKYWHSSTGLTLLTFNV